MGESVNRIDVMLKYKQMFVLFIDCVVKPCCEIKDKYKACPVCFY